MLLTYEASHSLQSQLLPNINYVFADLHACPFTPHPSPFSLSSGTLCRKHVPNCVCVFPRGRLQVYEAVPCHSDCSQYEWRLESWSICTINAVDDLPACGEGVQSRKIRSVTQPALAGYLAGTAAPEQINLRCKQPVNSNDLKSLLSCLSNQKLPENEGEA